ncbi:MAG: DUF938 domain-containing protein [Pseudomonadota bacterium]
MSELPFSEAADRNREPILDALRDVAAPGDRVVEIGSGTGQHAVHLAPALEAVWQPTELPGQLESIEAWRAMAGTAAVLPALELDVTGGWPEGPYDGAFSANTAHIMPWESVLAMLAGVARVLRRQGWFALYGPFNEDGAFTSDGNARLDAWARERWPGAGLRNLEAVGSAAADAGLAPAGVQRLPANNLLLLFRVGP